MHFLLKSTIQNSLAVLPSSLGQPIYYGLQRRFGALRQVDYYEHLRRASEVASVLHEQGLPLERSFLEVGTGWVLGTPIGLWLAGAAEIITVDLHHYLKEELVLGLLAYIANHESELQALYPWVAPAELQRKCQVLAACKSLNDLWTAVPIRYTAPADATHLALPPASVDYHYSTNVLEHVPPAVLAGILAEAAPAPRRALGAHSRPKRPLCPRRPPATARKLLALRVHYLGCLSRQPVYVSEPATPARISAAV
jgi:hypothetical protein